MRFATLLSESKNYLKKTGYLKEAPGDEEEETTDTPDSGAVVGGGASEDTGNLDWLGIDSDSAGSSEGKSTAEAGTVPEGGGQIEGMGQAGGSAPAGGAGGEEQMPQEEAPQDEGTGEEQNAEESAADKVLPTPPQDVMSVKGKLDRLNDIVDEFMSNMGNVSVEKELSIDNITNELAGILNVDEKTKKEVANIVLNKMSGLIKKLKKLRRINVDPENANRLQESIDNLRNSYLRS